MKYGIYFIFPALFSNIHFFADADHHAKDEEKSCKGKGYYKLAFQAEWSNDTHPSPVFPQDAKFSPLIGATHSSAYEMWRRGEKASLGVQQVAETGKKIFLYLLTSFTACIGLCSTSFLFFFRMVIEHLIHACVI